MLRSGRSAWLSWFFSSVFLRSRLTERNAEFQMETWCKASVKRNFMQFEQQDPYRVLGLSRHSLCSRSVVLQLPSDQGSNEMGIGGRQWASSSPCCLPPCCSFASKPYDRHPHSMKLCVQVTVGGGGKGRGKAQCWHTPTHEDAWCLYPTHCSQAGELLSIRGVYQCPCPQTKPGCRSFLPAGV